MVYIHSRFVWKSVSFFLLGALITVPLISRASESKYTEDWASLAAHNEAPEWFKDAKLGIYFHWGVYSVPAYGNEWYPRWMHFEDYTGDNNVYEHHLKTYGHPSEFGYHDFVPLFKAEHFDAEEWVDLFHKAGARFAGPVAEHHDGFSMWASEITPWNSMDKGPKRDITGEIAQALRKRNMKLITTFHHAKNLQRHDTTPAGRRNLPYRYSHYPFIDGMPPASEDAELKYLYGNIPEDEWLKEVWYGKLKEVVDKYHPDIIWFDSWLDSIPESYRKKFCAYYLNQADDWGKDVVIVRKQNDLPLDVSIIDLEKSRMSGMNKRLWMTDDTISKGSWSYTTNLTIKPTVDVLHSFIDIVSKNGVLLLNISPKADGSIPDDQRAVLEEIGRWMKVYGEAIYDTRPWITYGEGPTKEPEGGFKEKTKFLKLKYSAKDIRYTSKGNTVYAFVMGWPGAGETILLKSFANAGVDVGGVKLLGATDAVTWNQSTSGLAITAPSASPGDIALVYKIESK